MKFIEGKDRAIRSRREVITASLLPLIAAAALVGVWLHFRHRKKPAPPAPKIAVTSAQAKTGDIGDYLDAIGTVTPVYTASITSQAAGMIVAVHYREGQLVAKGDPLVDIDPSPYQATLLQAEGALARDEGLLAQARMDLARYQAAWESRAIAKQQLDDQEKLVQQDEGVVKNDQGSVQYARVQLGYCHIVSPIAGRVGLRLVDPGNVVQAAGTPTLAVVTQVQPITVVFTFAEDMLGRVAARLRQGARLAVDAYDRAGQAKLASGALLALDNQIDTMTGTVRGRAQFDNKDGALFPNQFVNVRLLVETKKNATLIPSSAVQQNGKASFVYVIQDGVAHERPVKPGVTEAGATQVDGIASGDVVADSGFEKLRDGAAVVLSTAAASGAAGTENDSGSTGDGKNAAPSSDNGGNDQKKEKGGEKSP